MTEIMPQQAQQALLSAPSTRQDIVSALLNDYGNSFGRGDASPSAYSPVPALKELPPPPPQSDSIMRKPLPAVQRMDMKFQLRDDQDAPLSPSSSLQDSPTRPPKRIASRSLSRGSKPASLVLKISNGSTATIPPSPAFPVRSESLPESGVPVEEKELPPPPPAKSERRLSVKQADMGTKLSKAAKELARSDSLLSPSEKTKDTVEVSTEDAPAPAAVKRKAVPEPGLKKFKSLIELGNGPRGRKVGPMPPTSAPRKASVDSKDSNAAPRKASVDSQATTKIQPDEHARVMEAQLPPTPDEDIAAPVPAPPKKVFAGLPSNPRAKGPSSPLHMRGKSSTGFHVLKAMRPAPPIPTANMNLITPEMTPSPPLKPDAANKNPEMSPVSPLTPPNPNNQRRPFSFEPPAEPQRKPQDQTAPTPPPAETIQPPLRTPSPAAPEDTNPALSPSRPTSQDVPLSPFPGPCVPTSPPPPEAFTPLTLHPISLAPALVPKITSKHLHCYTSHRHNIWSYNLYQPMPCMLCHQSSKQDSWQCNWCMLRMCMPCREELCMLPGRDLGLLLQARRERQGPDGGNPGIVVEHVDGGEEEEGGAVRGEVQYEDPFRD
ncbi:hypothetical protein BDW02DRAFT_360939 [Decorospora gaudefroyi]|uniref:Uncharacterized protein n=1 Tax=Decorospora gaudefroyi TaxID=184978 RepID=A0A6A5KH59_9PLEO|nr:hypothetical protein BDW02DRAFT_360939 [Decorospora gaudefroyi]